MLGTIGVLIVLGGVGDALAGGGPDQIRFAGAFRGSTALAPVAAISSSWYCAVATGPAAPTVSPRTMSPTQGQLTVSASRPSTSKSHAPKSTTTPKPAPAPATMSGAVIVLANTGPVAVSGTVAVAGQASVVDVPVTVPAHGKATVDESRRVAGSDLAATVVMDGGGVAVEQLFTYGSALTVVPCSSTSSSSWYFASGSTTGSDEMLVSLYNPLPTSAVVNLSFATSHGPAAPSNDQGIVVPAFAQVVVSVGAHVQQQALVATSVDVLDGRVVAEEVQINPADASSGASLCLGTPVTATRWDLAAGLVAPGTVDKLDVYNPSKTTASVQLVLLLRLGSTNPIAVSVAPDSVVEVLANAQPRIPHNSLFSVDAVSTNGVGVVVERSFLDQAPQTQRGLTETVGGMPGKSWVLASGIPTSTSRELVVVENPGSTPVSVTATAMSGGGAEPAPALSGKLVPPGRPVVLSLRGAALQDPLSIDASGPVLVEQEVVGPSGHGVSSVLGEPAG